jgi:hypothetical protein
LVLSLTWDSLKPITPRTGLSIAQPGSTAIDPWSYDAGPTVFISFSSIVTFAIWPPDEGGVQALRKPIIEAQHGVLHRLLQEEDLQLLELLGVLGCQPLS